MTTPTHPLPASPALIRQGSGEQAAAYIRQLIFDGQLRPGTRLPQDQIAAALGVSRIPVREAVVALEREGWVTTRLHRGAFVNAFDEQTIRDHYDLFGLIFGFAVRRAVDRKDPELVSRLAALAAEVTAATEPQAVVRPAVAFHNAVLEAAHSSRLGVVLRGMSALVPGSFFVTVPGAVASEQRALPAIVRAVRRGDGDRAAREYAKVLSEQGELVVELFRQRNLLDGAEERA